MSISRNSISTEHEVHEIKIFFYRDRNRVVEFLLPLENKQQIMPNNVETQHKHMYS